MPAAGWGCGWAVACRCPGGLALGGAAAAAVWSGLWRDVHARRGGSGALAQLKVDPHDPRLAGSVARHRPQLPRAGAGPPERGPAAGHPPPLATPLALRPPGTLSPLEDILTLLTRAGFSGPHALHIYRALFGFLHGHVLNELQELVDNPDETDDLLRLGLHRLPLAEFPLLRSLAPALAAYDGATELERGLDILLTAWPPH